MGAALRCQTEKFVGCNVKENTAYPEEACESRGDRSDGGGRRNLGSRNLGNGKFHRDRVALVKLSAEARRVFISAYRVVLAGVEGERTRRTVAQLLPDSFRRAFTLKR